MSTNSNTPKVLLIHGWQGSPELHWQAWLKNCLDQDNIPCAFPQLSDDMRPIKEVWLKETLDAFNRINANTVITHSLGAIVWFHLCAQEKVVPIERLVIVAPPRDLSDIDVLSNFFPCEIPDNLYCKDITLVTSSDDIYMNQQESKVLAHRLKAKHIVLDKAGHINADSNYGKWPFILDWVKGV